MTSKENENYFTFRIKANQVQVKSIVSLRVEMQCTVVAWPIRLSSDSSLLPFAMVTSVSCMKDVLILFWRLPPKFGLTYKLGLVYAPA